MSAVNWIWIALYVLTPVIGVFVGRAYNGRKRKLPPKVFEGETLLFSIGAGLALLIFWPLVAVAFAIDLWITKLGYWRDRRRNRFYCRPEHLLRRVTVEEAEADAKVVDLLDRTPNLPFGHLNPAWQAFLTKKKFGYRLKQFTIPGKPAREGGPEWSASKGRMVGFAWVGLRNVKAELICEWDA